MKGLLFRLLPLVLLSWGLLPQPARAQSVAGCWRGTWASTKSGLSGTLELRLIQKGKQLSGRVTIKGSPYISGGDIVGQRTGAKLDFGLLLGRGARISYLAEITSTKLSGTWRSAQRADTGSWSATRGCKGPLRIKMYSSAPPPRRTKSLQQGPDLVRGVRCQAPDKTSFFFKGTRTFVLYRTPEGNRYLLLNKDKALLFVHKKTCTEIPFPAGLRKEIQDLRNHIIKHWGPRSTLRRSYTKPQKMWCVVFDLPIYMLSPPPRCKKRKPPPQ